MLIKESYTRLTLALDIVRRIEQGPFAGYHELGVIKHRIDLSDTVTVEDAPSDLLECDDPLVPCDNRNVCMKVAALLRRECSIDRHIRLTIKKRIPVMGGLAGGSANAATTFDLLNDLWGLGLSMPQLIALSRKIGMDVPYYFIGGTAFDSEAGERLEPIATILSFTFVLALPDFGVATGEAYAGLDYSMIGRAATQTLCLRTALEAGDPAAVGALMHNDFEASVFSRYPRLAGYKRELLDAGCAAAILTGSGSTIIGVARDRRDAELIASRISCRTMIASTARPDTKVTNATA
jgi:4-diphosphocytidyl-2-C-methyl-D-erythritol kinase